ncbi:hypothetical protein Pelo_16893 [Pelomyxa schiedti]|nr:hypothetical protein Pelo_16893 [Pelomyxa schiedti]
MVMIRRQQPRAQAQAQTRAQSDDGDPDDLDPVLPQKNVLLCGFIAPMAPSNSSATSKLLAQTAMCNEQGDVVLAGVDQTYHFDHVFISRPGIVLGHWGERVCVPFLLDSLFSGLCMRASILSCGGDSALEWLFGTSDPAGYIASRVSSAVPAGGVLRWVGQAVVSRVSQLRRAAKTMLQASSVMMFSAFEIYNDQIYDLVSGKHLMPAEHYGGSHPQFEAPPKLPGLSISAIETCEACEKILGSTISNAKFRNGVQCSHLFFQFSIPQSLFRQSLPGTRMTGGIRESQQMSVFELIMLASYPSTLSPPSQDMKKNFRNVESSLDSLKLLLERGKRTNPTGLAWHASKLTQMLPLTLNGSGPLIITSHLKATSDPEISKKSLDLVTASSNYFDLPINVGMINPPQPRTKNVTYQVPHRGGATAPATKKSANSDRDSSQSAPKSMAHSPAIDQMPNEPLEPLSDPINPSLGKEPADDSNPAVSSSTLDTIAKLQEKLREQQAKNRDLVINHAETIKRLEDQHHTELAQKQAVEESLRAQLTSHRNRADALEARALSASQLLDIRNKEIAQLRQVVENVQSDATKELLNLEHIVKAQNESHRQLLQKQSAEIDYSNKMFKSLQDQVSELLESGVLQKNGHTYLPSPLAQSSPVFRNPTASPDQENKILGRLQQLIQQQTAELSSFEKRLSDHENSSLSRGGHSGRPSKSFEPEMYLQQWKESVTQQRVKLVQELHNFLERSKSSRGNPRTLANQIFDKYIKSEALSEVNLSSNTKTAITQCLNSGKFTPNIYDVATAEIMYMMMVNQFYSRFCGSRYFTELKNSLVTRKMPTNTVTCILDSLESLLRDSDGRKFFLEYLKSRSCEENVEFLMDVETYKEACLSQTELSRSIEQALNNLNKELEFPFERYLPLLQALAPDTGRSDSLTKVNVPSMRKSDQTEELLNVVARQLEDSMLKCVFQFRHALDCLTKSSVLQNNTDIATINNLLSEAEQKLHTTWGYGGGARVEAGALISLIEHIRTLFFHLATLLFTFIPSPVNSQKRPGNSFDLPPALQKLPAQTTSQKQVQSPAPNQGVQPKQLAMQLSKIAQQPQIQEQNSLPAPQKSVSSSSAQTPTSPSNTQNIRPSSNTQFRPPQTQQQTASPAASNQPINAPKTSIPHKLPPLVRPPLQQPPMSTKTPSTSPQQKQQNLQQQQNQPRQQYQQQPQKSQPNSMRTPPHSAAHNSEPLLGNSTQDDDDAGGAQLQYSGERSASGDLLDALDAVDAEGAGIGDGDDMMDKSNDGDNQEVLYDDDDPNGPGGANGGGSYSGNEDEQANPAEFDGDGEGGILGDYVDDGGDGDNILDGDDVNNNGGGGSGFDDDDGF